MKFSQSDGKKDETKMASSILPTNPVYVKHRVYWDNFEDYRYAYATKITRPGEPADSKVLTFRLVGDAWVLLWERDFCGSIDPAGAIHRFEQVTGARAARIEYAFHCDKSTVLEAERLARDEQQFADAAQIVDLRHLHVQMW
jgi:hypothetical protein